MVTTCDGINLKLAEELCEILSPIYDRLPDTRQPGWLLRWYTKGCGTLDSDDRNQGNTITLEDIIMVISWFHANKWRRFGEERWKEVLQIAEDKLLAQKSQAFAP